MAELNKKLHLLKPDSTQEAIKLYSTLAEVGDNYLNVKIPAYTDYYKWTPWMQPVLTANGSIGGSSFAVQASSEINTARKAWHALDGLVGSADGESYIWHSASGVSSQWYTMYFPTAVKVVSIRIQNSLYSTHGAVTSGTVVVSNDNTSWHILKSWTNSVIKGGSTWFINLDSNTEVYNYYRIVFSTGTSKYVVISELELTAYYAEIATASDYDYVVEIPATTAYAKLAEPTYYKWTAWIQPVFTTYTASDGSVISASSEGTSWNGHAWRAMDGHTSGGDGNFWGTTGTSTGWWKVVFPYKIAITKLVHYNRDNTSYSSITGQYFADVAMTIPIGSSFTNTTSWGTTTVYDSSTPIVTDTIYFNKTAGNNSSGIGELVITAKKAVESTSDDYDYLENPVNASSLSMVVSGVKYKVITIAKPAYTEVDFTTAGTFTWTAPANVTKIKLAMVGGGGSLEYWIDDSNG